MPEAYHIAESRKAVKMATRERSISIALGILLWFQGWNIAGVWVIPQFVNLGLACIAFVLLFLPFNCSVSATAKENLFKLLRFPLFYIGAAVLLYVLIQALNSEWRYVWTAQKTWYMTRIPHLSFLPSGSDAPFYLMNPWRMLVIIASYWLAASAFWVGIRHRRVAYALLWLVIVNAVGVLLYGLYIKVTDPSHIYWGAFRKIPMQFGGFYNRNHAGVYLYLGLFALLCLLGYFLASRSRQKQNHPSVPAMLILVLLLSGGAAMTLSRAAMGVSALFVIATFFFVLFSGFRFRPIAYALSFLLMLILGGFALYHTPFYAKYAKRLETFEHNVYKTTMRKAVAEQSWEMFQSKPLYGWGAGTYRYHFPKFQKKADPALTRGWYYAHNDYVQILAELGMVGGGLVFAAFIYCLFLPARLWRRPHHALTLLLGVGVISAHAYVDYLIYTPSIAITFIGVFFLGYRIMSPPQTVQNHA